jgi:hypothetical protein
VTWLNAGAAEIEAGKLDRSFYQNERKQVLTAVAMKRRIAEDRIHKDAGQLVWQLALLHATVSLIPVVIQIGEGTFRAHIRYVTSYSGVLVSTSVSSSPLPPSQCQIAQINKATLLFDGKFCL